MRQLLNHLLGWRRYIQLLILQIVLFALVSQLVAEPAMATGVREMPTLKAGDPTWIIDDSEALSLISKGTINKQLSDLAKDTGSEVRFVTIHRLDYGETPASFTNKLFEKWFPTTETQANQVLLVLDTKTNGTAIQTGSQVKSKLSDETAESIASETMQVPIRKGNNYNQAFLDASDRLTTVLSGLPDPGPPKVEVAKLAERTFKTVEETDDRSATYIVIGLLLAATIIPMVTYFIYQGQGQS
jgi:uncharacterized protein